LKRLGYDKAHERRASYEGRPSVVFWICWSVQCLGGITGNTLYLEGVFRANKNVYPTARRDYFVG